MTDRDEPTDARVTYNVRDLLNQLRVDLASGFARVETTLSNKADKADVARLDSRMDAHETKIAKLQDHHRDEAITKSVGEQYRERSWTARQRILAIVGAVSMAGITALASGLGAHLFLH